MYLIKQVQIDGFWHRFNAKCEFNENVNIIIGANGTGKTTFMTILQSILSVDLDTLLICDFRSAKIILKNGRTKKTIEVIKEDNSESLFQDFTYYISQKKFLINGFFSDDYRISTMRKRRAIEQSTIIKQTLKELVNISSLSVYRLNNNDEYEARGRDTKNSFSHIDIKLKQLYPDLVQYQLNLSQQSISISIDLQNQVLMSLLDIDDTIQYKIPPNFDKKQEQKKLLTAYYSLVGKRSYEGDLNRKVVKHIDLIDKALSALKNDPTSVKFNLIRVLESFSITQKIIELSLEAERKTKEIYSNIEKFKILLNKFLSDKQSEFKESGELIVKNKSGNAIDILKLSSGEKQLLILLIGALLQKSNKCIFITDEPELSLHIEWQRNIIPAIKEINPNAQIIVATHSPEIASKYRDGIHDMQDIING